MISLLKYTDIYEGIVIKYIIEFFGFRLSLNNKPGVLPQNQAMENLELWTDKEHELYVILEACSPVGFLHISYKGGNVAWIEDVFVEEKHRGKGTGSRAITEAEQIIKKKGNYTAVCMDVVPQNISALSLYHKIGYDTISAITVRKELGENNRTDTTNVLGYNFKI